MTSTIVNKVNIHGLKISVIHNNRTKTHVIIINYDT